MGKISTTAIWSERQPKSSIPGSEEWMFSSAGKFLLGQNFSMCGVLSVDWFYHKVLLLCCHRVDLMHCGHCYEDSMTESLWCDHNKETRFVLCEGIAGWAKKGYVTARVSRLLNTGNSVQSKEWHNRKNNALGKNMHWRMYQTRQEMLWKHGCPASIMRNSVFYVCSAGKQKHNTDFVWSNLSLKGA